MQTSPRQKHNIVILRDLSLRMLSSGQQREKSYSDRLPEDDWVEPLQFWQCHLFKTEGQTAGCFSLSWRLLQDQDNTTYHTHGRQHIPLLSWIFPCLPMFQGKLERGRPDLHWGWCNAPASGSGMVSMMCEFSSSAWFSEISNLFFSSSSFDHLILIYFSAIQWISSHLENAIWTENLYTTVHFPASKFVNLKALLSRWYQLHFYSDLVFVPES